MDKYNRNYKLLVQKKDGTNLEVARPFTVEFDIHRNSFSSANVCSIRVYNLNPNNRLQIRQDQYDYNDRRLIEFLAGYGDKLSLGFKGNINQAWSVREGVNFITQIECYDGGFAYVNAVTGSSYPEGSSNQSIIDSFVDSLGPYGVQKGSVGTFPGKINKGASYTGNPLDHIGDLSGDGFFIDNQKINILKDDECIDGDIPLINSSSGLLGTPILESQYLTFDLLFEPSLKVGQLIELQSVSAEHFNGIHKVIWLKHKGMISEAVCGTAITSVGLLPGSLGVGNGRFIPIPQAR